MLSFGEMLQRNTTVLQKGKKGGGINQKKGIIRVDNHFFSVSLSQQNRIILP